MIHLTVSPTEWLWSKRVPGNDPEEGTVLLKYLSPPNMQILMTYLHSTEGERYIEEEIIHKFGATNTNWQYLYRYNRYERGVQHMAREMHRQIHFTAQVTPRISSNRSIYFYIGREMASCRACQTIQPDGRPANPPTTYRRAASVSQYLFHSNPKSCTDSVRNTFFSITTTTAKNYWN